MKARRKRMSNRKALNLIRRYQPKTLTEFEHKMGFTMKKLGEGVFRECYRINQCNLVVKFAVGLDGREHNSDEVSRVKRLWKTAWLRPHLPKVHYHDPDNGVLVMEYYKKGKRTFGELWNETCLLLQKALVRATGVSMNDIHEDNLRLDDDGCLKFIDLGY